MKRYDLVIKAEDAHSAIEFADERGLMCSDEDPKNVFGSEWVVTILEPIDDSTTLEKLFNKWVAQDVQPVEGGAPLPMGALLYWTIIPPDSVTRLAAWKRDVQPTIEKAAVVMAAEPRPTVMLDGKVTTDGVSIQPATLDNAMHAGHGEYCRAHDLFACPFAHGPAHADRRRS